jgi:hypothetical protein
MTADKFKAIWEHSHEFGNIPKKNVAEKEVKSELIVPLCRRKPKRLP